VGNDKALIVIRAPKKEAGNKTLKIRNEMWSYLKNTETTIKIPPSMMLQSWNGSDFTNDDLVRESNLAKDYTQKIIANETFGGEECWKIELVPKPEAPVVWGRLYSWIRKKDYVPAATEYYDERGRKARTMLFTEVKSMGGRIIPTKWTMVNNLKEGNQTSFRISRIAFDERIPDRTFSFQELERGN
jgi:outer membrane lipoprotein-sorting protein